MILVKKLQKDFQNASNSMHKLIKNNLLTKESKSLSKKGRLSLSDKKLSVDERSVSELDVQVIYVFDDVYTTGTTISKAVIY